MELRQADIAVSLDSANEVWDAKRPDIVAAGVLRRFEGWRAQVHEAESRLTETYRFSRFQNTGAGDIEFLHGQTTLFERFRTIQGGAHTQVRAIDRPPYYWDEAEILRQEHLQSAQMAAGVVYRTIYQESASDSPVRNATMTRSVANGESARVLADPPIKMTFVDDEVAVVALDPPAGAEGTLVAVLVYQSALLQVLSNVFESLWRLAVPVNLARLNQDLSLREREILTLMASGAGDDAIARRLGVSRRTIVRHIGRLLEHLGATTRFQAGAQAARRGWL
ncbi:MAG: response regulator transcription factor [Stackebrandtia sp.]